MRPGDVVRLRSGGLPMTVEDVTPADGPDISDSIGVVWFESSELYRDRFGEELLETAGDAERVGAAIRSVVLEAALECLPMDGAAAGMARAIADRAANRFAVPRCRVFVPPPSWARPGSGGS